jgi:flavodoxin
MMKAFLVYDTRFGNTEAIARAIGEALGSDTAVVRVTDADGVNLESVDLFIVGSPTQGARHTLPVQNYLDSIPEGVLNNVGVATFDTRYSTKSGGLGTRIIARMAKGFGFAAPRIADILKEKGGNLLAEPEGFIVNGTKGPLKDGELERTAKWAEKLAEEVKG